MPQSMKKPIAQRDNDLALEAIKKSGKTTIYTPSKAEAEEWKRTMLPVHKEMEGRIGADLIKAMSKEAAKFQ